MCGGGKKNAKEEEEPYSPYEQQNNPNGDPRRNNSDYPTRNVSITAGQPRNGNGKKTYPLAPPREHGPGCVVELALLEKHGNNCRHFKFPNPEANPEDDQQGSYHVVGRVTYHMCARPCGANGKGGAPPLMNMIAQAMPQNCVCANCSMPPQNCTCGGPEDLICKTEVVKSPSTNQNSMFSTSGARRRSYQPQTTVAHSTPKRGGSSIIAQRQGSKYRQSVFQ